MMKKINTIRVAVSLIMFFICAAPVFSFAQDRTIDATTLIPRVSVSLSPRSGSFVEGSTFEMPIFLDTRGSNVNAVEIKIAYDASRLAIVQPSGGKSIIGVWAEPPSFNNTNGTASYVGVIPNGITTEAGLVGSITFKALRAGSATVSVQATSNVLLNDGIGTPTELDLGRAVYSILTKAPDGVSVYSETHPSQSDWYNNNSPVFSWELPEGVTGFSVVLDTIPTTVPPNSVTTANPETAFEDLADGIWYLHVKALKGGVWGSTTHFSVRIDTSPPASFTPSVEYVLAAAVLVERVLVSFFTTDNLSGVHYYEVGVIDKTQPTTISPVFVEAVSPFQVPFSESSNLRVIVRAVDQAGNVRDESINVSALEFDPRIIELLKNGLLILFAIMIVSLIHPFFRQKLLNTFRVIKFPDVVYKVVTEKKSNKNQEEKRKTDTSMS